MNPRITRVDTFAASDAEIQLNYAPLIFPGGEVHVKLDKDNLRFKRNAGDITIHASIRNSEDFLRVAMLKDAVERFVEEDVFSPINLFCPYVPYARQDRRCDEGEAFSLKVFAGLLNSLSFNKVTIVDPHSDVTPALINNVEVITQLNVFENWEKLSNRIVRGVTLVAPDAGANKKTSSIAKYFAHDVFIRADKLRDLSTGKILETIVYVDDLEGRDVMAVDDLCDGGATFIGLATALKKKNAGKVLLYVTHGIFSKGLDPLFAGGIDEIWTTDAFRSDLPADSRVQVLALKDLYT